MVGNKTNVSHANVAFELCRSEVSGKIKDKVKISCCDLRHIVRMYVPGTKNM